MTINKRIVTAGAVLFTAHYAADLISRFVFVSVVSYFNLPATTVIAILLAIGLTAGAGVGYFIARNRVGGNVRVGNKLISVNMLQTLLSVECGVTSVIFILNEVILRFSDVTRALFII